MRSASQGAAAGDTRQVHASVFGSTFADSGKPAGAVSQAHALGTDCQLCLSLLGEPQPSLSHGYQKHLILGISNIVKDA